MNRGSHLWSGFGLVGISVALWRMLQVGSLFPVLAHRLSSLGLHGSADLDISVRDGFLDKAEGVTFSLPYGKGKVKSKTRGKNEAYGDSMLIARLPNHIVQKFG